jgi:hypothetical protein
MNAEQKRHVPRKPNSISQLRRDQVQARIREGIWYDLKRVRGSLTHR